MNERIKELAKVAEQLADDELAHLERVHNRLYSFTEGREIYNQKFAELIVRECISCSTFIGITTHNSGLGPQPIRYTSMVNDKIRKHFGVEE